MNNFGDFCEYLNNESDRKMFLNEIDAYKTYYDSYSNYLVSKKYNINDIKTYRMNSVIDCFITINNLGNNYREELRSYYLTHVKDTFDKRFNPPRSLFFDEEKLQRQELLQQQYYDETDDIKQHYLYLQNKSAYFADLLDRCNQSLDEQVNNEYEYSDEYTSDVSSEINDYNDDDMYDEYDYDESYENYENEEYYSDYDSY